MTEKKRTISRAEMRRPSEYGGTTSKSVAVAGRAASTRSAIVRSDPTDPRSGS